MKNTKKNKNVKKTLSKKVLKKPMVVKRSESIKINKEVVNLPKIKVVGIGGSGKNATNYMIKKDIKGIKFVVINTDAQDLNQSKATKKVHIGKNLTEGAGTGMDPKVGKKAALETKEEIANSLKDSQMVFLTGGMGGGTGTGATPVVASIAKEMGILTIAVVTKPFSFEGKKRLELAEEGISELSKYVDSYIVIENDRILEAVGEDASMDEAFALSDEILRQAVEGISDLITKPGRINIDYADIKTVLENSGIALIGIGSARGKNRASAASELAINSPLIETSTSGSQAILFSIISSGDDLKMSEISQIAESITKEAHPDAIIKFGTVKNSKLRKGEIKVIVVASRFEGDSSEENLEGEAFGLSFKKPKAIKKNIENPEDEEIVFLEEDEKEEDEKDIFSSFPNFFRRRKD